MKLPGRSQQSRKVVVCGKKKKKGNQESFQSMKPRENWFSIW